MKKRNEGLNYYYGYDGYDGYGRPQDSKKKVFRNLFIVFFIIVANLGVFLAFYSHDKKMTEQYVQEMLASAAVATPQPTEETIPEEEVPLAVEPSATPTPTPEPVMIDYLKEYYDKNNDLIGWLKIEDTPIDYPVMYTPEDEDYYLEKDFNGDYLKAGTLFVDADTLFEEDNTNTIIYGHNMKNQTMFGSLKKYASKSYYEEHKYITFDTLYEKGTYEIYAAFYAKILTKADTSFKYYIYTNKFSSTDTFNNYIGNIDKMKLYTTSCSKPVGGDRIITLSTCSSHTENGRFAIIAKKIK